MKVQLEVNVQIRMTIDESLELEQTLAGVTNNPTVDALKRALQIQNSAASRLRATGTAA